MYGDGSNTSSTCRTHGVPHSAGPGMKAASDLQAPTQAFKKYEISMC